MSIKFFILIFMACTMISCTKRGPRAAAPAPTPETQSTPAQWSLTGPTQINAGTCAPFSLTSSAPVGSIQEISLTTTGGAFYTDSQCETPMETFAWGASQTQGELYFQSLVEGTYSLLAAETSVEIEVLPFARLTAPAQLSFSPSAVGESISRILTVENSGPSTISIWNPVLPSPFSFTGGSFPGLLGTCDQVGLGQQCDIEIQFTPESSGAVLKTFELSYLVGASEETLAVALSGQGLTQSGIDPDFNAGAPIALTPGTLNDRGFAVATNSTGEIFIAGSSRSNLTSFDFYIGKLKADGTVDTTFGSSGSTVVPVFSGEDRAIAIALEDSGKIYVGGYGHNGSDYDFIVMRFLPNGALDSSFGSGGVKILNQSEDDDFATGMTLLPNGKIILVGYSDTATNYKFSVASVNSDGTADGDFDGDGWASYAVGASGAFAQGVKENEGKLYIVGYAEQLNTDIAVLSLNTDGTPNNSFGTSGIALLNLGYTEYGHTLAIDSSGGILVGGTQLQDSTRHIFLTRLLPDGSKDLAFTSSTLLPISPISEGQSLCVDGDNNIYLTGYGWNGSHYQALGKRYLPTGAVDGDWADSGTLIDTGISGDARVYGCAIDTEERLILVGDTRTDGGIWKGYLSRWSP